MHWLIRSTSKLSMLQNAIVQARVETNVDFLVWHSALGLYEENKSENYTDIPKQSTMDNSECPSNL